MTLCTGIFTNIRQCKKFIENFENKNQIILHEIRLNEPSKGKKDMTKLLKENNNNEKENNNKNEIVPLILDGKV
jgi:predicted DNA-binding protein YlxM (UPF0122 family)